MLYIDFDGVILDTEKLLFEEWRKNPNRHLLPESEKIKYIQKANWDYILNHAEIIANSIYYLSQMNPKETFILTKIHSLTNEGSAKMKWMKKAGIKQATILVPYNLKKSDVVLAKNNILIDDCLKNLDDWSNSEGYPVLFDSNDDNYDSWNQPNKKNYEKVLTLSKYSKKTSKN